MATLPGSDATGATPLEPEDLDGLIPTFIATRGDLNVAEQANIEKANLWAFRGPHLTSVDDLLSFSFSGAVHRRMFGDVWRWAGQQRTRETNVGVEPHRIVTEVKAVLDDARYWHEHDTFGPTERAVRLHHRLVSVHPYRNGNGRHARFMADLYLHLIEHPRLPWGGGPDLVDDADRTAYIAALRAADAGDIEPLLGFART